MTGRGRIVAIGVTAAAFSTIAFFGVASKPPLPPPPSAAPGPSRLVILFDVDTMRADRLGTYGYTRPTSPNLDRIMADGLVADHAITSAGWTLPAHASIFSSQSVAAHGVRTSLQMVPESVPLLAEVLSKSGVRCLGIHSGGYVDNGFGFFRGFAAYLYTTEYVDRKVKDALRLIDRSGPEPLFLFLHSVQVHNYQATERGARAVFGSTELLGPDWQAPVETLRKASRSYGEERVLKWLSARYDAAARETDESLGELVDGLKARGLWIRTALVFTSDHGEEIGERPPRERDSAPARGHTIPYLYEEHIRIPLAVRAPWRADLRGRLAEPVSSIDVAPTILDLFDLPIPPSMTGAALGRLRPGRVIVSEASPYGAVAVLEGTHKAIVRPGFRPRHWETGEWLDPLPSAECFDLTRDPGERHATSCAEPWARALLEEARRYIVSSFPGDLVVRAEPHGRPCRLEVGPRADVQFFGEPPNLDTLRVNGMERLSLIRVDGPVWIAVSPSGDERALSVDVEGCGDVRTAGGERLSGLGETGWSDLLWRGAPGLPDGTVVFSVAPGKGPQRKDAKIPDEVVARLHSLGYASTARSVAPPAPSSARPARESVPPGRVRIRVGILVGSLPHRVFFPALRNHLSVLVPKA